MIDVDKLNNTITELENQSLKIKSIGEVYESIKTLTDKVEVNKDLQEIGIKEITTIGTELESSVERYSSELEYLKNTSDRLISNFNEFEVEFLNYMKTISSENNKFYIELQQILSSKLDRHKSDIELEIRKINDEVQKTIAREIKPALVEMQEKVNSRNREIDKKFKVLYIIGIVSSILGAASLLLGIMK